MIFSELGTQGESEPIEFKYLEFKYNFSYGSQDSIELHDALNKCKDKEIFKSEGL